MGLTAFLLKEKQWSAFSNFHYLLFNSYFAAAHTIKCTFQKVLSSGVGHQCILHNKLVVVVVPSPAKTSGTPLDPAFVTINMSKMSPKWRAKTIKPESRIKDGFIIGSTTANFVNGLECKSETEIGHETAAKKRKTKLVLIQTKTKKSLGEKIKNLFLPTVQPCFNYVITVISNFFLND